MTKTTATLVAFGLLAAACGAAATGETAASAPPTTTAVVATTGPVTTEASTSETNTAADPTTTAPAPEPIVVDGPPAPDFALALADGRGFILSEETKPVYMIFWAEW